MSTRRTVTCLLLAFALVGCGTVAEPPGESPARKPAAERSAANAAKEGKRDRRSGSAKTKRRRKVRGTAVAALARLPVKGRAPKTGYSREQFGDGWVTIAGCDTRERILRRDLKQKVFGDGCSVISGVLDDPYTRTRVRYVVGGASEVEVDHVVALSDAWQKGAQQWTARKRVRFANDPLNLLAVDAGANRQKGDGDAATWLPPNTSFRCAYVARQVAVKRKYRLWVTRAEWAAIERVLARCPGQKLPKAGKRVRVRAAKPAPVRTPERDAEAGAGRYFPTCDDARAAGAAPLYEGTADYETNPHLDRDKDGVGCE